MLQPFGKSVKSKVTTMSEFAVPIIRPAELMINAPPPCDFGGRIIEHSFSWIFLAEIKSPVRLGITLTFVTYLFMSPMCVETISCPLHDSKTCLKFVTVDPTSLSVVLATFSSAPLSNLTLLRRGYDPSLIKFILGVFVEFLDIA